MLAIEPQSKGDLDKMGPALARMLEEEPTVRLERSTTGEQILRTMGEAHTAVIIERLKRKFGAAIVTHTPRVPYKETIRGKTQVHGRYKKQTGGHGMFGDVWLELEPNPDGGVEFAERIVGGAVPKGFFAGVEKGIREAAEGGVLAGYPLSDFRATLYDGSFHPVDSNEMAFKIAASMALKDGVHHAKPALLEPIMARRDPHPRGLHGRGQPRPQRPARPRPRAWTPTAASRSSRRTSRWPRCRTTRSSSGRWPRAAASFTMTLDHYDDVPAHIAEKVIESHRKELEAAGGTSGATRRQAARGLRSDGQRLGDVESGPRRSPARRSRRRSRSRAARAGRRAWRSRRTR